MAKRKSRKFGSTAKTHRGNAATAERNLRTHLRDVREFIAADNCPNAARSMVEAGVAAGLVTAERESMSKKGHASALRTVSKSLQRFKRACVRPR